MSSKLSLGYLKLDPNVSLSGQDSLHKECRVVFKWSYAWSVLVTPPSLKMIGSILLPGIGFSKFVIIYGGEKSLLVGFKG